MTIEQILDVERILSATHRYSVVAHRPLPGALFGQQYIAVVFDLDTEDFLDVRTPEEAANLAAPDLT